MSQQEAEFTLTQTEAESALWRRIDGHLRARLEILRAKNDSDSNDIKATTLLRGQIKEVQRMLALADEAGPTSRESGGDEFALVTPFPASTGGFVTEG